MASARIVAVCASPGHGFSKPLHDAITLVVGLGIAGDAHCGAMVKHRSRLAIRPLPPNLRQVHLVHSELFRELEVKGFAVRPGDIGENVTTAGLDLLALPRGTLLRLGGEAVVEITGLRNPCRQLDRFQPGLMQAVLDREAGGGLVRKAGIMSVVRAGGIVRPGDPIAVELPPEPRCQLEPV